MNLPPIAAPPTGLVGDCIGANINSPQCMMNLPPIAAPPTGFAGSCIGGNINSLECMMNADNGGFQPGDLVIPAGGDHPKSSSRPHLMVALSSPQEAT